MPCMKLDRQIIQKLHAVSNTGNERTRDLIDLQIIINDGNADYGISCNCKPSAHYSPRNRHKSENLL